MYSRFVCSHDLSSRLKVVGRRIFMLFIASSVLITSGGCALDTRSSARDNSTGQTERVVYIVSEGRAKRGVIQYKRHCLTAVLVWIY